MALTVGIVPWMTFNTPAGRPYKRSHSVEGLIFMCYKPACSQSSARIIAAPGSRSEGLRIRVFPVTVAIGIDHSGIILHK